MRYEVDQSVFLRFPGFRRAVVVARGLDNGRAVPEWEQRLRDLEGAVREEPGDPLEDPRLLAWMEAFRALGLNPKRFPPSVVNLVKRVRGGKPLPFVNPLVGLFNCVSLEHRIPCGGDDLGAVTGDLALRFADGDESYHPLGQPEAEEHPAPGEVVYLDTGTREVFCRAWCWKNGDRSKILPTSREVAINLDGMDPVGLSTLEPAARELARTLTEHLGGEAEVRLLTPENRSFDL